MGIFRKRGADIDFTDMQKRGFVRTPQPSIKDNIKVNSQGFVEFLNKDVPQSSMPQMPSQPNVSNEVSPFGFLDNLGAVGGAGSTSVNSGSTMSGLESNLNINNDIANVKVAVDNLDFKLGNLMERLGKIESKLLEFENKVNGNNFRF